MLDKFFNTKLFFFSKDIYIKQLVFYGLLLRFLVALGFYTHVTKLPDSYTFMELAEYLLRFDLNDYNGLRSPGYPILMFLAFGKNWLTVIYQFFIGVYTFVLLYKSMLNLNFSSRISFICVCLCQGVLNVFFYETSILLETLSLFFMVLLMYEISKGYLSKNSFKTDLWVGFIVGYLALIKPFYAYIGFVVYGLYVLNDFNWRKIISRKLILIGFPLMVYFGWSYVNKVNTGHFVSTTFFGLNISQNCVYFAEKGPKKYEWISKPYAKYRDICIKENRYAGFSIWDAYEKGGLQITHPNFPDFSAELGHYAVETIKMNPTDYFKQVVFRSWFDFWKPAIYWEYEKFNFKYVNKLFKVVWYMQYVIIVMLNLLFVGISFSHAYNFIKTKKVNFEFFGIVLVWVSSVLQALVTYGTNDKYRFPFEFIIFLVVILFLKRQNCIPKRLRSFLQ